MTDLDPDPEEVTMVDPNRREFYHNKKLGIVLLKNGQDNVLTNIRVPDDERRGNGFSRVIIHKWLNWCFGNGGYNKAYVVNIKSDAIIHVLDTLDNYNTKQIENRNVPYEIVSGHTIPDRAFKIEP